MGKNTTPPPPDMTPLINASIAQSQRANALGEEQLAWAKEQYGKDSAVSKQVVDAALARQQETDKIAREDRERYKTTFQPMEDSLVAEAKDYATPERQELAAGRAMATNAEAFETNRQSAARNLESFGVDPSSTRFAALDAGSRIAQAASAAASGNKARQDVENTGRQLRSEAIQVGQQYPGYVQGAYSTGIQSGNAGLNSQLATTGSGANTMGTNPQYQGIAATALGGAADMTNKGYANQLAAQQAEQNSSSGIGSILGAGIGLAGMFLEEGGAIPTEASPTGGQAVDDVPAQLTAGEFVIPKDVLNWKGEEFFQKLIEHSRKVKPEAPAQPERRPMPVTPQGNMPPPAFVSRPQAIPAGA